MNLPEQSTVVGCYNLRPSTGHSPCVSPSTLHLPSQLVAVTGLERIEIVIIVVVRLAKPTP